MTPEPSDQPRRIAPSVQCPDITVTTNGAGQAEVARHPDHQSIGLYLEAATPAVTNKSGVVTRPGRPAHVRLCGPIPGACQITDPERLRHEARRLLYAARLLELEQLDDGEQAPLDLASGV